MKEKPILFSAPMVNAILEGRKSMTRRTVKPQPYIQDKSGLLVIETKKPLGNPPATIFRCNTSKLMNEWIEQMPCPYGNRGDRLWVKESYILPKIWDTHKPSEVTPGTNIEYPATDIPFLLGKRRPGIFMCRWMSRITLEIIDIRVERLQDITEDDALAEGVTGDEGPYDQQTPRMCFETLWDSINGKKFPWSSNPRVLIRTFRRVDQ